jgi:hypothetical protein
MRPPTEMKCRQTMLLFQLRLTSDLTPTNVDGGPWNIAITDTTYNKATSLSTFRISLPFHRPTSTTFMLCGSKRRLTTGHRIYFTLLLCDMNSPCTRPDAVCEANFRPVPNSLDDTSAIAPHCQKHRTRLSAKSACKHHPLTENDLFGNGMCY